MRLSTGPSPHPSPQWRRPCRLAAGAVALLATAVAPIGAAAASAAPAASATLVAATAPTMPGAPAGLAASPPTLLGELPAQTPQEVPQRPGAVAGRVLDFDGTPLPGVSVRIEGPGESGEVRRTTTNAEARFEFFGLAPGVYNLAVELSGAMATATTQVVVQSGVRVSTTLELDLFASDVSVTVQARADTTLGYVDPQSTGGRNELRNEMLDRLPLPAEQVLEALPIIPGVVRGPEDRISVDGTFPADSILLFNGIDLMDPFSGEYRVRLPLEAVQRVELYNGVYPAVYGQVTGGIVDVSTAPGGETWKFEVSSFVPRPNFANGTIMGIKRASPRVRVSGPLADGLYLSQSGEYHFDRSTVEDVPGDPTRPWTKVQGWDTLTQLDWRPSARHAMRLTLLGFPQMDEFTGLDGVTPLEATSDFERDAEAVLGQHTWLIDDSSSLETMLQYNRVGIRSSPQGPSPLEVIPEGFRGNAFHREDRQTSHSQGRVVYTRRFGGGASDHLMQVGGDFHNLSFEGLFENDTVLVRGADDRLLRRIDFTGSTGGMEIDGDAWEYSAFVQDRWSHGNRFWCDLGLRYSTDTNTDDHRFSPRIGVAWDPFGAGRTLLKAASGLMYRRVYLGEVLWQQLPTRIETDFAADGTARTRALVSELADELAAPWSVLTTLEASHQFGPDFLLRLKYYRREGRDLLTVERREPTGFLSMTATDAGEAGFIETLPELPAAAATGSLRLSNTGELTSWGFEVTTNWRIRGTGELFFSYVRSSAEGDLNDFGIVAGEMPDPIIRENRRGPLPFDAPHRFLAWGILELPLWELMVVPLLEWRSGFPYSVLSEDGSYLGDPNAARFPAFFSLDAQVTKDFEIAGYLVTAGVKLRNVTSHFNPRNVIANVASPRFGELRNNVPLKLGAKIAVEF